jgi:hypothetical protein
MNAKEKIKNEPVMTAAGGTSATVLAVFALLSAFGVNVAPEVQAAVITLAAVILPPLYGWLARQRVTPVRKLEQHTE